MPLALVAVKRLPAPTPAASGLAPQRNVEWAECLKRDEDDHRGHEEHSQPHSLLAGVRLFACTNIRANPHSISLRNSLPRPRVSEWRWGNSVAQMGIKGAEIAVRE